LTDKTEIHVDSPDKFPPTDRITESFEPMVKASIVTPPEYLGDIIKLLHERRAHQQGLEYLTDTRILLKYRIPLGEVILDFFDSLKCCSSGYASFDYEEDGYASAELVKVSILLNAEPVEELSAVVPRVCAEQYGRGLAQRLKAVIPRQLYQVAIQAAIGSKIIARETYVRRRSIRKPQAANLRVCVRVWQNYGVSKGRTGQVLRWRRDAQEEVAREAEGGQEANALGRTHRGAAGGLLHGAEAQLESTQEPRSCCILAHLDIFVPVSTHDNQYCSITHRHKERQREIESFMMGLGVRKLLGDV